MAQPAPRLSPAGAAQLGAALRRRRRTLGWTIEAAARRAGYCRRTVERVERGDTARLTTIFDLAQALGIEFVATEM